MKRKILVSVVMALISYPSFAIGPRVDFGVKAGINASDFDLNNMKFSDAYWLVNEARTGYHAGVVMRVNLTGFHVQPELNYNWNTYNMNMLPRQGAAEDHSATKVRVRTFEVPVLGGLSLLFLRINAGPVFNLMTKTSTPSGSNVDVTIQKPSVSLAVGLGIDVMNLNFDVRYNGQFRKSRQNLVIGDLGPYDFKNNFRNWTFSLGYMF